MLKKLFHIVGNRPHFIKLGMLYNELKNDPEIDQFIVHTGQHSSPEMSDIFFADFQIPAPHFHLGIENHFGSNQFIASTTEALEQLFKQHSGIEIFTYGDTNSTLAAAMAAKRSNLRLHHFEAGIRTGDFSMPEEMNRVITDRLADVNYCCTQHNLQTMLHEGYATHIPGTVHLTGDLMLDAFLKIDEEESNWGNEKEYVACTIHRVAHISSIDQISAIISALNDIHKTICVKLPMHPHTRKKMEAFNLQPVFDILPPLGYRQMKHFLKQSSAIITDSGGVSREAYFCGKKSLIISKPLFWPEIAAEGCAMGSLPNKHDIISSFNKLPDLPADFNKEIFGDGNAASKIHTILSGEIT